MPLVIPAYVLGLIRGSGDNNSNTFSMWKLEICSLLRLLTFSCTFFQCVRRKFVFVFCILHFLKISTWFGLNQIKLSHTGFGGILDLLHRVIQFSFMSDSFS
jgi:hypothetical protein